MIDKMNKGKIKMSEEDCNTLCDLIRSIILKVAETEIDTDRIALGLSPEDSEAARRRAETEVE